MALTAAAVLAARRKAHNTQNADSGSEPAPAIRTMDRHSFERAAKEKKNAILAKILGDGDADSGVLWGLLRVRIVKCRKLRNFDALHLTNVTSVFKGKTRDKSDPYVEVFLDKYRLCKTRCIDDELNPVYDEEFYCPVAHIAKGIEFKVMDKDYTKDDCLGEYSLPASDLFKTMGKKGAAIRGAPNVAPGDQKRVGIHKTVYLDGKKRHGSLEFSIEYIPARMLPKGFETPGVYFTPREGNEVKLYMNADDDGSSPVVKYGGPDDNDKVWKPRRLWRDIYDAMCDARHFIYVVGWSVDTDQSLLRGREREEAEANGKYSPVIGQLLKSKADEGLVVNLMQWDDMTSNVMMPGMNATHDEKTRNFFANTKVNARVMGMVGGDIDGPVVGGMLQLEGRSKKLAFTHHQKFVVLDSPRKDGEGRELLAFVGGIDLTTGRWDNRRHPLFRSLQSDHKGDMYTACFNLSTECGPREPWHDIHSSVRGPEAIDLATAFEERWNCQGKAGELINRGRLGLDDAASLRNDGGWCTQLSRSIDSRVNSFDPSVKQMCGARKKVNNNEEWISIKEEKVELSRRFESNSATDFSFDRCLDHKKGRLVDNSIHVTNVHHIRRAEHFIYIESQYFMGSSFMWSDDNSVKCGNMIAAEITLKICEKIAAKERFAVYILLPMWMEGITETAQIQGLLYYQRMTIEAMYKRVEKALNIHMANSSEHGLEVSDYLNFYCLGTRETSNGSQATGTPTTNDEILLSRSRRHQIYVHSKMMIVDDDVALIGTANINQRSMDGCRDSEIMMTSWQPDHSATKNSIPRGDIHGYRMHVWASITGQMLDEFRNPGSRECVRAMNKIANENWRTYLGSEVVDMKSHLLPFALEFNNGRIGPRKGLRGGYYPDTKGSVLGKKSMFMPELLLT